MLVNNQQSFNQVRSHGSKKDSNVFASLMQKMNDSEDKQSRGTSNGLAELLEHLLTEDESLLSALMSELSLTEETDLSEVVNMILNDEGLLAKMNELFNDTDDSFQTSINFIEFIDQASLGESDKAKIAELIEAIESELNNYLSGNREDFSAMNLISLMEQWVQVTGNYDVSADEVDMDEKSLKLWQQLLANFKRRNSFATNNHPYKKDAVVTAKDVTNWLAHQMKALSIEDSAVLSAKRPHIVSMANVEQYSLYINQASQTSTAESQLLNQLEQSVKMSRLFVPNSGINQLSFTLRPDNLGEMIVRLVDVQGEMTVKIIVSSQATRNMLEANLHQLKHMFSPQQVVIEEREIAPEELQENNEQDELKEDEDEAGYSEEQKNEQREADEDESFTTYFEQFLLNEEV